VLLSTGDTPVLDIARHDGTPAGERLRDLLAAAGPGQPLVERYATRVHRTHRLLRSGGAVIELALDEGEVRAGERQTPLCEIEFELVSGPPAALLAVAGRWAGRHGLVLDMRSKSELGHTLAAGLPGSPPILARRLQPAPDAAALLAQALRPVLANASQIAAGWSTPDHGQQLHRALRRLRRLLARGCLGAAGRAQAPAVAALQAALVGSEAAMLLARPATQRLWLDLLALGLPPG
jgi:inorganic triphosphatase YgiF